MADIDDDIDRLYQGPLDAFTEARNALAKSAKRPDVKTLVKPSLPAWAVNQLHWHRRPAIDRLVTAAEAVRREHGKTLSGRSADIRSAEQAHRDVVREVAGRGARPARRGRASDHAGDPRRHARHPAGAALARGQRPARRVRSPRRDSKRWPASPYGAGAPRAARRAAARKAAARRRLAGQRRRRGREPNAEAANEPAPARRPNAKRAERRKAAEQALETARAVLQRAEIALDDAERVHEAAPSRAGRRRRRAREGRCRPAGVRVQSERPYAIRRAARAWILRASPSPAWPCWPTHRRGSTDALLAREEGCSPSSSWRRWRSRSSACTAAAGVTPGLFPVRATGVSTAPIVQARRRLPGRADPGADDPHGLRRRTPTSGGAGPTSTTASTRARASACAR